MTQSPRTSPWNSLEVVKVVLSATTPVLILLLGIWVTGLTKHLDATLWANQKLVEKRIAIYDDVAPLLNDLLCYFSYVGGWKELSPPEVIALKRKLDRKMYVVFPLLSNNVRRAYLTFMFVCFRTHHGWAQDARLRTKIGRRRDAAGSKWIAEWDELFLEDQATDPEKIRSAYQDLMNTFSADVGIASGANPPAAGVEAKP